MCVSQLTNDFVELTKAEAEQVDANVVVNRLFRPCTLTSFGVLVRRNKLAFSRGA